MLSIDKKLVPVFAVSFMNTIGFSLLIPVMPFLVERYGGGPILYGVLLSLYSIFQFVGSPVLGALSDAHGRKPVLLISHGGTLVGWLLFVGALYLPDVSVWTVALPLIGIAIARIVDGITGGNISVANAAISDLVSPEERPKTFGMMMAVFGFGMLIGPVIGGLITATRFGFAGVGMFAALVSLLTLVFMWRWLPETLPPSRRSHDASIRLHKRANVIARIAHYAQNNDVKMLLTVRVLFSIGFVSYVSIFIFHAIRAFHLDELQSAKLMLFTGSFLIVNQLFMVRRFVARFGESKTFSIGQLFMMLGLLVLTSVHTVVAFAFVYYFINLGVSLSLAVFKSLILRTVTEKQRGEIMGIEESLVALVQAFVPVLASILYASAGFASFAVFAFFNAAVFAFIFYRSKTWYLRFS